MSENREIETKKLSELTIGQILKSGRENLKITISEVSQILKIKTQDISLLEQDNINLLPSHLYLSGLIKSYAKLLKLDMNLIEKKIQQLHIDYNTSNKKHQLLNIGKKNIHSPSKETFLNAILVFTILYLIFFMIHFLNHDNLITTTTIVNEFNQI